MEIDYRSIVIFLHKKGKTAREITVEINETFQQDVIGYSTVTRHLRSEAFSNNKKDVKNKEKNWERNYLSELIVKTLRDFPFFSTRQIAEHCRIDESCVYRILTVVLNYKVKHLRWIPHSLTPSQKVTRVELAKSLLKALGSAKKFGYHFFYTGDESWFYLSTDHTFQWLPPEDPPEVRVKKTVQDKKYMLTIFWNPNGFSVVKVLPENERFTAEYFINNILKELYEKTKQLPNRDNRKVTLHYDNARPHTARKVTRFLEENHMKKAPHPPYSPDIAPCDFFLFGYIKDKLKGESFESVDSLLERVKEILNGISKEILRSAFTEWERRLIQIINTKGDYI